MAEYLYVCHFSNGHIKVGRSIEPQSRVAVHADRVACMGVELVEHFVVECSGPSEPREAMLIARCATEADRRHQNEWFSGLDYLMVVEWAQSAAAAHVDATEHGANPWPGIIASLRATGLSQTDIARLCSTSQNNVSRLANGITIEPAYSLGKRIIELLESRQQLAQATERR